MNTCRPSCHRFALLSLLLVPLAAQAERYAIDPVHSRVLIRVSHAGFSQSMATLSAPSGTIDYDPDHPEQARVNVELSLDRLDFGDAEWNRRMARRDYFDSARHPRARFVSTSVAVQPDGELRILGQLELRGTQAPIELHARINRTGRSLPWVSRMSLGASASARLDRRQFGMLKHAGAVGHDVEVWIEVEARRQRQDTPGTTDVPDAGDTSDATAEPDATDRRNRPPDQDSLPQ